MNVDEARSDDVSGRVDDLIVCGRPDLPDLDDLVALDPNIIAERGLAATVNDGCIDQH